MGGQFRPGLGVLVLLGLFQNGVVVGRIGLHHLDLKQIGPGLGLNFLCDPLGVAAPGEVSDQHISTLCARALQIGAGHRAAAGCGVAHQTEAHIEDRAVLRQRGPIGRAEIFGEVVPASAPVYPQHAAVRAGGISLCLGRIVPVIIPDPLAYITVHIIEAPGIGLETPYGHRGFPVDAGPGLQIALVEVVVLNEVGVMAPVVGLFRADGGLRVEGRLRPRPAGVLPLRLGGQTIAVGAAVPGHGLSLYGVGRIQALQLTAGVAVCDGVQPGDGLHRQIIAGKGAGIGAGHSLIFRLGHFKGTHIEVTDCDGVLRLVITAPGLTVRTAHGEGAALHQNKVFGDLRLLLLALLAGGGRRCWLLRLFRRRLGAAGYHCPYQQRGQQKGTNSFHWLPPVCFPVIPLASQRGSRREKPPWTFASPPWECPG